MIKALSKNIGPWSLFSTSINILIRNPIIFYPFCILGFIQLLTLEILYFAPRYPLSKFFAPLITTLWSEKFLHYPFNLILLSKLFYYAQAIIYFLAGNFLLAIMVGIIIAVNQEKRVQLKLIMKEAASKYIHLCCCSAASFGLFFIFNKSFDFLLIKETTPKYLAFSSPYIQLVIGSLITVLLSYVIPIIMFEKKKIIPALFLNFKMVFSSFWLILTIVFIPSLFYFPILVLRDRIDVLNDNVSPEVQVVLLVISILFTLIIDVIITTSITSYYLLRKENYED